MERVKERLAQAERAAAALAEALSLEPSTIVRDAAIQRFEFTFEATWKEAKAYLFVREGVDVGTPKAVLRACHQAGMLGEAEILQGLLMADDRNLTSHTYDEALAVAIFGRLASHLALTQEWLKRMGQGIV